MRYKELEKELRPATAIELRSPLWKLLPPNAPKEGPRTKWPVHEHCNSPLLRQGQKALLRNTIGDGVIQLNEVNWVLLHRRCQIAVLGIA